MINLNSISEKEIFAIKQEVLKNTGINLKNFKTPFLSRRIITRMLIKGIKQGSEYAKILSEDPGEAFSLYKSFSINITEFFRNPKVWETFSTDIVPQLMDSKNPHETINVWSAGCATGQEPYSLAIMLRESLGNKPIQIKIYGTDMNSIAITMAKTGIYELKTLKNIPHSIFTNYFSKFDDDLFRIKDEIKNLVEFNVGDVGSYSLSNLDIIVCRNLLIYYGKEAQELLFKKFYNSLNKKGFVILGMDETMIGSIGSKIFQAIHPRERIFKKIP